MKIYLFAIACFSLLFIVGCTDDELIGLDACDYILPEFDSTQKYSNDLGSFEMHIGPDTIEAGLKERYSFFDTTEVIVSYGCGNHIGIGSGYSSGLYDHVNLAGLVKEDYTVDEIFDARSMMEDYLDLTLFDPAGPPLIVTFGVVFDNADENGDIGDGKLRVSIDVPDPLGPPPYRVFGMKVQSYSQLAEKVDQHEVNGTIYEDVIRVELDFTAYLYRENANEDTSPIRQITFDYWFAKGIGLIETTDHNYKLDID